MIIRLQIKRAAAMVLGLVFLGSPLGAQSIEKKYEGFLIVEKEGTFRVARKENVRFSIRGNDVKDLRIRLEAATKDLTFLNWRDLKKNGSNYATWFVKEGRNLDSFDGTPYTYEPFLIGVYAGLSPILTADYVLYAKLKEVADKVNLPVPERTFVIYNLDGKPIYEFFCYPFEVKT